MEATMLKKVMGTRNDVGLTIVRVLLGAVLFMHGAQKMLGWFGGYGFAGTMGYFTSLGIPYVFGVLAICAEFLGGLGLLIGLLSRVAAFGILVNMVMAVLLVHLPNGVFMNWGLAVNADKTAAIGEGYEFHVLAIGMALAIIVGGGGAASADAAIASGSR
jgi:putative oxidoreductase